MNLPSRIRSYLWAALCIFVFFVAPRLRAQATWTGIASPVSQNLWGVCAGGGLFVAVGENGTIVTSPDGLAWTKRATTTTQWLTAVSWSPELKRFLAVGGAGTFLMSTDGVTWSLQTSTATRRNGLVWGGDRFFVVGEDGFLGSSFDATEITPTIVSEPGRWMRGAAVGAGVAVAVGQGGRIQTLAALTSYSVPRTLTVGTGDLEGIVFANNAFTAIGYTGSVQTSPDGVTWTAHPGGPSGRSLVYFNGQFVAVGEGGSIATTASPAGGVWTSRPSPITQTLLGVATNGGIAVAVGLGGTIVRASGPPVITMAPVSQQAAVGDSVIFRAAATGDNLSIHWTLNGKPLPDISASCFRPNLTAADAGDYTMTVSNSAGSVSATARLTLDATAGAVVDTSFAPSSPDTAPAVIALAGDKIFLGGNFSYTVNGQPQRGIARLNADGSLDTTFAGGGVNSGGMISSIVVQPDGKIVVGGSFTSIAGVGRLNMARLNADGSYDSSYAAAVQTSNVTPSLTHLLLDASGRAFWSAGYFFSNRLTATGSVDLTFGGNLGGRTQRVALDRSGRIMVVESGALYRMTATGSRDFAFLASGFANPAANSSGVAVHPNAGILLATDSTAAVSGTVGELTRYNANGSADPTFTKLKITDPVVPRVDVRLPFVVSPEGKIYVGGDFPSLTGSSRTRIARLNADGSTDATYNTQAGANGRITALALQPDGRLIVAGEFTSVAGVSRSRLARLVAAPGGYPFAPELVVKPVSTLSFTAGDRLELGFFATTGSGPFSYQWVTPTATVTNTTGAFTIEHLREFHSGLYTLTISGPGGTFTHVYTINVGGSAPRVLAAPRAVSTQSGRTVTLAVEAYGGEPLTYQWYRGETPVGTNSSTLTLANASAADTGDYRVVVRNRLGEFTSNPASLTLDSTARLGAISTRAFVGANEQIAIAGFVVEGQTAKRVLVRGVGPGLAARFGLAGVLADPKLTLYNRNGEVVLTNDNWSEANGVSAAEMEAQGLFKLDAGSKDAATALELAPGNYTVQLASGTPGGTGIGLIEIYEADTRAERLLAISTRAFVGSGDALAIPGFAINGPVPKKILVRAVGPTMASMGIASPLADPVLTLVNSITGEVIAANDDWSSSPNKTDIVTASAAAGNFPLPDPSKDAVLLVTVPPGNYTALVRGANGGTGVALVEVYEVP